MLTRHFEEHTLETYVHIPLQYNSWVYIGQ
jgi:hypothetical protein